MKWIEIEEHAREEGRTEGRIEDIMDLLEEAGLVSEELEKRVRKQRNLETLKKWHKLAARAKSIEEFENLISEEADKVTP